MSIEYHFTWICDQCGCREKSPNRQLPNGWTRQLGGNLNFHFHSEMCENEFNESKEIDNDED